jgi:hypothetical protein
VQKRHRKSLPARVCGAHLMLDIRYDPGQFPWGRGITGSGGRGSRVVGLGSDIYDPARGTYRNN